MPSGPLKLSSGCRSAGEIIPGNAIFYVAFGERCRAEVVWSARSLRRAGYVGPVHVLTESPHPLLEEMGAQVVLVRFDPKWKIPSGFFKTRMHEISPYEKTLVLDTDTLAVQPFDDIWPFATGIAAAVDILPSWAEARVDQCSDELSFTDALVSPSAVYHNAGVFLLTCGEKVRAFYETWAAEWQCFGACDQLSLARTIVRTGYRLDILPHAFNFWPLGETTWDQAVAQGAKIVHLLGTNKKFYPLFLDHLS